ncbi:MAG: hypothetical protein K8F30_12320 [Taibaiella sp.]|nr:hypothetical protein [Taibaiella sp.]
MKLTYVKDTVKWRYWRFSLLSFACIIVSLGLAFFVTSPTSGYVQWPGTIISLIAACCCLVCFFLVPRRPIALKVINFVLPVFPIFLAALYGSSTAPKLTAEDRKQDIEYLANWARDYSPFVELNEKQKGVPSYEALKPKYMKFAEEAESNEDFYLVASSYFNVIGASGHAYLFPEDLAKWSAIGQFLGICDWGISSWQLWKGTYWSKLSQEISTRAHPPFFVINKDGTYYTDNDWQNNGITVPSGSQIVSVSGMTCSTFLDYLKTQTHLRYDAFPKDWLDKYLLFIDEGRDFHGWLVKFLLPNDTTLETFVPKVVGIYIEKGTVFTTDAKENCTCVELTDSVGYIRIKNMWRGPLSYVFKGYLREDRQKIQEFLEQSQGKYKKLIIDVQNNMGGIPEYVYEVLIRPFLEKPITVKQIVGLKKKYLQDTKPSVLRYQKEIFDNYIIDSHEIEPPDGFEKKNWVFYQITRKFTPSSERYNFDGKIYVLINGECFSATDDYADLLKRTGLGILVGQNTGGMGCCFLSPPAIRLPKSRMIFRLEADLTLTPSGKVNEIYGTEPDVKLRETHPPKSMMVDDLLEHLWIKKIISGL